MSNAFDKFILKNVKRINNIAVRLALFKIDSVPIGLENAITRVNSWLGNFDAAEISMTNLERILTILEKMDFITSSEIAEKLSEKSKSFFKEKDAFIAPLGEESESSYRIQANYNQHARFYSSLEKLLDSLPADGKNKILLYDDFLNSGGQVVTIFKTLLGIKFQDGEINDEGSKRLKLNEQQKEKLLKAEIHLFYYKAFDNGAEYVERKVEMELQLKIKVHRYTSADVTDGIFGDKEDVAAIKNKVSKRIVHGIFKGEDAVKIHPVYKILKDAGHELLKFNEPNWSPDKYTDRALGYGNEGRIIITDFNVPTNTITCLWMSGKTFIRGRTVEWEALLPRRKKILDHDERHISPHRNSRTDQEKHGFDPDYDYLAELHTQTVKQFIKKKLIYDFSNETLLNTYDQLFSEIGVYSNINELGIKESHIFQNLLEVISDQTHSNPLIVSSPPGGGKNLFLSLLYSYLYDSFKANRFTKIPVYINLDYFAKVVYEDGNLKFQKRAEEDIRLISKKIKYILRQYPGKQIIVIVDGVEEYENQKANLVNAVYAHVNNAPTQSIAGIRKRDELNVKDRAQLGIPFSSEPLLTMELSAFLSDQYNIDKILKLFAEIKNPKQSQMLFEHIKSKIAVFSLKHLDLLILEVLSASFDQQYGYRKVKNFSHHLEVYFSSINRKRAGQLAHKAFNFRKTLIEDEVNCREWWYINKHEQFKNYFIAYHVVEHLLSTEMPSIDTFNFVYPHEHNSFFKEILNKSRQNQKTVIASIKRLLGSLPDNDEHTSAKTHLCYLLGRFSDDVIKEDSRTYLKTLEVKTRERISKSIDFSSNALLNREQKKALLLYRTIIISLIYLGDSNTSQAYIGQLRENKYLCNLNRGFHLEYYGDIKFDHADDDSLKHEDNIGDYCGTYDTLYQRVSQAASSKSPYSMFEIELYTLVSLAQHRQVANNVIKGEAEKRQKIVSLLDHIYENEITMSQPLMEYLDFVKEILEKDFRITEAHLIADIFEIKKIKRTGWVKSGVEWPESVADHIYGTYVMASYYLPEKLDGYTNYDKQTIFHLLLNHDLPEWKHGDVDGSLKTEDDKVREEKVARNMSLLGTYTNIANATAMGKAYYNFTYSNDINCKIARDIDKLEMLQQLAIYKRERQLEKISPEEFRKLKTYSQNVQTDIGKKIREKILLLFDVSENSNSDTLKLQ